jgi:hypothetical protein
VLSDPLKPIQSTLKLLSITLESGYGLCFPDRVLNLLQVQSVSLAIAHGDFSTEEIHGLNTRGTLMDGINPCIAKIELQKKFIAVTIAP